VIFSLVASIVSFLSAQPHIAYATVFLLALSQSISVLGVVVPGKACSIFDQPWNSSHRAAYLLSRCSGSRLRVAGTSAAPSERTRANSPKRGSLSHQANPRR
jgi:hypothetical protein